MTTKTSGAEFKRFYADTKYWPDNGAVWHEDEEVFVNGQRVEEYSLDVSNIADSDRITIAYGVVFGVSEGDDISFETYFKRWRKEQTTVTLVVECDRAKADAVKAAIKAAGGRAA